MTKLSASSIKFYKITLFVSFMVMMIGVYAFVFIPKQDMPDIVPPFSSIQILSPGYSVDDVLKYVTEPVEDAILAVEGVDYVDTISLDNIAIFNVVLDIDEIDTESIFDQVYSEISALSLPSDVMKPTVNNIILSPHAIFSMTSETLDLEALTALAERFSNELLSIDTVSKINVIGPSNLGVYLEVDIQSLNTFNLTMNDVLNVIKFGGLEVPSGSLVTQEGSYGISIPSNYQSIEEISNIVIGMNGNIPLRVSDVAEVSLKEDPHEAIYKEQDNQSIFLELYFKSGIDFTVLGNDLIETQEKFMESNPSVMIERMTFQPEVVNQSLNQVYSSLILGIVLVLVIIFIGLGIRNALSVAFTFPLIILSTISAMFFLDQDLQKVTIAALIITIGIIVDNAIVISESIQFHIDEGKSKLEASLLSVKENNIPVLASSLTTIAAFIPFMVIGGATGKMIRALPITVSIAIAISYVVAMLIVPVFGAYFFKMKTKKEIKTSKVLTNFFDNVLPGIIKKPKLILSGSLVLLLVSLGVMVLRSPLVLFPVEDDNIIYIDYAYENINDKDGAHTYALDILEALEIYDEIYYTAYSVGGDLPNFGAKTQINNVPGEGRIFFRLDVPYHEIENYVKAFNETLLSHSQISSQGNFLIKQLTMNFGGDADATLALYSYDEDILKNNVSEIALALEAFDGVAKLSVQDQKTQENIVVTLNRNQVLAQGLTMVEVQQQIALNMNGSSFQIYEHEGSLISLNIEASETTLEMFKDMNIKSSKTNQFVSLDSIATFEIVEGIQLIKRHNGNYQIQLDVYFEDNVQDITFTNDIIEYVESMLDDTVQLSLGGQAELRNDTFTTLGIASVVAIIVVYFILFVQFNSFKTPLIILITVPLSLIGSALFVGLSSTPISFTMIFGITSLIGIVVNMGILLIDYINKARLEGETVLDACVLAVQRRIRPILLSSITTIMGLIPLALFGGAFFVPMAVSLMGGLIASTALTIFVVPTLYYMLEKK
jgi:multidrug efflux pump